MPTHQGRTVLAASLGLVVAGRMLGVSELWLVGTAGLVLTVVAVAWARSLRLGIDVVRTVHPTRIHAGASVTVEMEVTNRGRRTTPVLHLHDLAEPAVPTLPALPPLRPGGIVRTSYTLRCEHRGITAIGPLEIVLNDPFGLVSRTVQRTSDTDLVVWPALRTIAPPEIPCSGVDGRHRGRQPPSFSGSDLVGLRPYRSGDDLRHVHWRASARYDDLMVRELEAPPDDPATVIVDARASTHTRATFEQAITAATSILIAYARRDARVRLVITSNPANVDHFDSGPGSGERFIHSLLDKLAFVEPNPTANLPATLAFLHETLARRAQTGSGCTTVLIGGDPHDLVPLLDTLHGYTGELLALAFTGGAHQAGRLDPRLMVIDETSSFEEAWARSIGRA